MTNRHTKAVEESAKRAEADRWNDPETHDGGPDAGFPTTSGAETEDFLESVEEGLLGDERARAYVEAVTGRRLPLLADEIPAGVTWSRGRKHKPTHEGAEAYRKWARVTLSERRRVVLKDANPSEALAWAVARRRQLERKVARNNAEWDAHVERVAAAARGEGTA